MSEEDFTFKKQKENIDLLFATLLQRHSLNEIYEMDILELLRLTNLERIEKENSRKVDSLFSAFNM